MRLFLLVVFLHTLVLPVSVLPSSVRINSMDCQNSREAKTIWLPQGKPHCRYGFECYRRSEDHKTHFSHPTPAHDNVRIISGDETACADEAIIVVEDAKATETAPQTHSYSDSELARRMQLEEWSDVYQGMEGGLPGILHECKPTAALEADETGNSHGFVADGLGFRLLWTQGLSSKWNQNSVRLRDVVKGDIQWAVLTNYKFDMDWLLTEMPQLLTIPRVAILHHASQLDPSSLPPNFSCFAPLVEAWGTHHSKALLLGYPKGLRVVVITANHVYGDHYEMTDGLWAQDFPLKSADASPAQCRCPFEEDVVEYFNHCGWKGMEVPRLGRIGVSQLRRYLAPWYKFIDKAFRWFSVKKAESSIAGRHSGSALHKFGHMKLRAVLSQEAFASRFCRSPLVWQCTSIGSLTDKWLEEFTSSLSAGLAEDSDGSREAREDSIGGYGGKRRDGRGAFHLLTRSGEVDETEGRQEGRGLEGRRDVGRSKLGAPADEPYLVWPCMEEMRGSIGGWAMGDSIPGAKKNVERAVLQALFCRWSRRAGENEERVVQGRSRSMPHIKTFLRFDPVSRTIAWLLFGSHNLSGAAWGKLEKNSTQLHIRSYELSVLLLPSLLVNLDAQAFSCTATSKAGKWAGAQELGHEVDPGGERAKKRKREYGESRTGGETRGPEGSRTAEARMEPASDENVGWRNGRLFLPLPYHLLPERYKAGTDSPWMCDVPLLEPDTLGCIAPCRSSR